MDMKRIYEYSISTPKGMYVLRSTGMMVRLEIADKIAAKVLEETGEELRFAFENIDYKNTIDRKLGIVRCTGRIEIEVPAKVQSPSERLERLQAIIDYQNSIPPHPFEVDPEGYRAWVEEIFGEEATDDYLRNMPVQVADEALVDFTVLEGPLTPEDITEPLEGLTALPDNSIEKEFAVGEIIDEGNLMAMGILFRRGALTPEEEEYYLRVAYES
jgi:hypothetical protein